MRQRIQYLEKEWTGMIFQDLDLGRLLARMSLLPLVQQGEHFWEKDHNFPRSPFYPESRVLQVDVKNARVHVGLK